MSPLTQLECEASCRLSLKFWCTFFTFLSDMLHPSSYVFHWLRRSIFLSLFIDLFFYLSVSPSPHSQRSKVSQILFVWNKATSAFGTASIEWTRKYIYALIVAIFVGEIITSVARALEIVTFILFANAAFYIVVGVGTGAYILYTSFGLYRYFSQRGELGENGNSFHPFQLMATHIRCSPSLTTLSLFLSHR